MFTRFGGEVPPGFEGRPLLYMTTLFSLLLGNILCLEWIWRSSWSIIEKRRPLRSPTTVVRVITMLVLFSILIRSGPDMLWLALWHDLSRSGRAALLVFDSRMDTISFVPLSLAWLAAYLSGPMLDYQLSRYPLPLHLWPTKEQLKRPLKIGVAVLIISAAITFLS
jgi:hypothetical protein